MTRPSHPDDERPTTEGGASLPETRSSRRLSALRKAFYRLGLPLALSLVRFWWRSCRIVKIIGHERAASAIEQGAIIPVYWHGFQLFCVRYLLDQRSRGLSLGFLISPSVDGELPAMAARLVGAHVIRGSSNYTGARALRDYYVALQGGISPAITPDGPSGPAFEFKMGAILLSQLSGRPIVPLSFGARRAWRFTAWDRFFLPWPFSRIVVAVGEPRYVPKRLDPAELSAWQREMAQELESLHDTACAALQGE
jgi:hypothetical protein